MENPIYPKAISNICGSCRAASMQIFIRIPQRSTFIVHAESSDSIELLQRLVCTQVDWIQEKYQQLSFRGRQLAGGLQLTNYGICCGSTLQLDAPLRGGNESSDEDRDVHDGDERGGIPLVILQGSVKYHIDFVDLEGVASYHVCYEPKPYTVEGSTQIVYSDQSAPPDLLNIHIPAEPSQCALHDHTAITCRPSPPYSASITSLPHQTSIDPLTTRDAGNLRGEGAAVVPVLKRLAEAAPGARSACALTPFARKRQGGHAAALPAAPVPIRRGERGGLALDESAMDPQSRRRVLRNRASARASRRRKQEELSRLSNKASRLRERVADLGAALTHVRAHARLAEVRALAEARLLRGQVRALRADRTALRDAILDARAELAVLPRDCCDGAACGAWQSLR
jgi:hypothetical protein